MSSTDAQDNGNSQEKLLETENRRLHRVITRLENKLVQNNIAFTTLLNQQKATTFIQRERERYLALLLANSPNIILFLGETGRIEFCTEYFLCKTGHKNVASVQGYTLTEVLAPFLDRVSHDKVFAASQEVVQTNRAVTFDITFHFNPNQQKFSEDYTGLLVPMKDTSAQTNGLMLMLHDVTDLKRSREEALAASKAKSSFLSNMSHEIRTPINAIIGMTSIGKQRITLAEKDDAFESIENASSHLLGIINDILDLSKIESGKMELSDITFDVVKMIDRIIAVSAQKIREKQQHLSVEISPDIPKVLFGDDQRLAQVIANLLSNASKFTANEGAISLKAKLISQQDEFCQL